MSDELVISTTEGPKRVVPVGVDSSVETFNTYRLADGSVLKLRTIVTSVQRGVNEWDGQNLPRYFVAHTTIISVESAPPELKRK